MGKYQPLTSADQINNVPLKLKEVDVDEWERTVTVSELTGTEMQLFRRAVVTMKNGKPNVNADINQTALLLCYALRTPDGRGRLYSQDAIEELAGKGSGVLERLAAIAMELSGMSPDDDADAEGNSETTPTSDSSTT